MERAYKVDFTETWHTALANLGYPGFSHRRNNLHVFAPSQLVTEILSSNNVDARTLEALAWILVQFPDLDWEEIVKTAVLQGWQNRLGYMTTCASTLAVYMKQPERAADLHKKSLGLMRFLRKQEDTLCHESMTQVERRWLIVHCPPEARQWNLLTDLVPEYAHAI